MSDDCGYNQEAYFTHAREVAARFEKRRAEFLRRLKFRAAVGLMLLVTFPLWYSLIESFDVIGPISSLMWFVLHIVAGVMIIGGIIAYVVMPLFRYRHYTVQIGNTLPGFAGVIQQHVSLKGEIFSQLFRFFGNFTLSNDRKLSLRSFRDAPGMPEFDDWTSEDYIRGTLGNMTVEMTEVKLFESKSQVFSGLFVLIDINDPNLALHGKFSGQTIIIAGQKREGKPLPTRYGGFRLVELPGGEFEIYSTLPEEAKRFASPDLLTHVLKLADAVRTARNQVWHTDDRIAFALNSIAHGISDVMAVGAKSVVHWFNTGSFRIGSQRHDVRPVSSPSAESTRDFREYVHCAFYRDKVLISIPNPHDLFEPETLFHPPLLEDDLKLVYELMTAIDGIAGAVVRGLPKDMV